MKFLSNIFLILALGGSLFLLYENVYKTTCDRVIYYDIGEFDTRFNITKDFFITTIERAELPWEEFSGKNIFRYKEGSDFKVNLIYGEEQERIDKGGKILGNIDTAESTLKTNERRYDEALKKYKRAESDYKNLFSQYEKDVSYWNAQGGAPKEVFDQLNQRKKKLDQKYNEVRSLQKKVNTIVEQNNSGVDLYNNKINSYNELFGHGKEFHAGNTDGTEINILSYKNEQELYSVLVHEFGHVLGIDHLEDESSVMFYLLNEENKKAVLSDADKNALSEICRL